MPLLRTRRLAIDPFSLEDCDFIIRLLNDSTFIDNIEDKGVRTREQAAAYLATGPLESYRTHGHGLWRVALAGSGTPIGMCGLIKREELPDVDLGYAFLPEYCGLGYAREAAEACLDYGRDTIGLGKVTAIVNPGNARSSGLLLRLGFSLAGMTGLHGENLELYERLLPAR